MCFYQYRHLAIFYEILALVRTLLNTIQDKYIISICKSCHLACIRSLSSVNKNVVQRQCIILVIAFRLLAKCNSFPPSYVFYFLDISKRLAKI